MILKSFPAAAAALAAAVLILPAPSIAEDAETVAAPSPTSVIPKPVSTQRLAGQPLMIDAHTQVTLAGSAPPASKIRAVRTIKAATGIDLANASGQKTIVLRLDKSIGRLPGDGCPDWQAAEAYRLTVAHDGTSATITAAGDGGLFYGVQTLVQLAEKTGEGKWQVPSVKIDDYPRFHWRGYMLDPARQFRPKSELFRYMDLMALHKLNVLHLHLTDSEGWRIEIKKYPKLIEVGSRVTDYTGKRGDNWFYSQDDIRELVAYAADRCITIVPEIEMPGQSKALTTSYPELSCAGQPAVKEICVSKEETFTFMANVLNEVAAVFPSPFVHVGGDEVEPKHWRACPRCKKRMEELVAAGLPKDVKAARIRITTGAGRPFQADISRLQGQFMRRIDRHLAKLGKRMIGWDEIVEGGLSADSRAAAMVWRSDAAIAAACRIDHDLVVSTWPQFYLDVECPLEKTYALEPVPASLSPADAKHVLGVQGNMWGERVQNQERIDWRTFPRLCAIAEIGWSPKTGRDFPDFTARLKSHEGRLVPYGIRFTNEEPGRE